MDRIDALRAYCRLVERGSFTAAATALAVKQSTVSKWVVALEQEVGVGLVERTTRAVRVTQEGQRFYSHALLVLSSYDDALAELQQAEHSLQGKLALSVPEVFGRLHVMPLLARFLRQHPHLHLEVNLADRYVNLVQEGFDLAVRVGLPVDSSLRCVTLATTPRRLVASPGYINAHGAPEVPADLARHECLVHSQGGGPSSWTFVRRKRRESVSVRGRVAVANSEATLALARSGLGIALLASWLVDGELKAGRLVTLLPDHAADGAPVQLLFPPGRHPRKAVKVLAEALKSGLGERLATH